MVCSMCVMYNNMCMSLHTSWTCPCFDLVAPLSPSSCCKGTYLNGVLHGRTEVSDEDRRGIAFLLDGHGGSVDDVIFVCSKQGPLDLIVDDTFCILLSNTPGHIE